MAAAAAAAVKLFINSKVPLTVDFQLCVGNCEFGRVSKIRRIDRCKECNAYTCKKFEIAREKR